MILTDYSDLIFIINLASCIFMTGVIWYVQIVVYPQLRNVSAEFFPRYYSTHTLRTGFVVGPPMLLELVSGVTLLLLAVTARPATLVPALIGFTPLLFIWLSTLLLQIPQHARLEKQRDERVIEKLIKSNWIRTLLWSFRSVWLLTTLEKTF